MRWSIIVCTLNRPEELRQTLAALRDSRECRSAEVIVVDNSENGDARYLVEGAAGALTVVYVHEPRLGLSHARNAGIAAAHGELVAFLDDDASPEPGWLAALERAFDDPAVMGAGGMTRPSWPAELAAPPPWLHRILLPYLSVILDQTARDMRYPHTPVGANMAFRGSVFARTGAFAHELGRTGDSLMSLEESELFYRIERAGFRVAYVPGAVVHHRIARSRLRPEWFLARVESQGRSVAVFEDRCFGAPRLAWNVLRRGAIGLGLVGALPFAVAARSERWALLCRCQLRFSRAYLAETVRRRRTRLRGTGRPAGA